MLLKPFFEDKAAGITLWCGDCREILPLLSDLSVDMVLTDPPYTEEVHDNSRRYYSGESKDVIDFDPISEEDLYTVFGQFGRICTGWTISTLADDHTYMFKKTPPAGLDFVRAGVWVKPNTSPHINKDRPPQGWESIAHLHQKQHEGRYTWHGGNHSSVYIYNFVTSKRQRTEGNVTAKPRPLYGDLIRFHSNRGDTILDAFAGSGTALYMAKALGRRAIGIEIDPLQCEKIVRSLYQEVMEVA